MLRQRLAYAPAAAVVWLILASGLFLWMSGLLNSPAIPPWTRPWQWIVYARLGGRTFWEVLYLSLSAIVAACPFIALLWSSARLRPAKTDETPPIPIRAHSDLHGHANWLTEKQMRRLVVDNPVGHGAVVMGVSCRADLHPQADGGLSPLLVDRCLEDATHGLLFIGSGGGKTSSSVVPTLDPVHGWRGNVFVNDPSTQAGPICAEMRRNFGQRVVCIGPPSNLESGGPVRVGINVLGWINPHHALFEEQVWAAVESLGREKTVKEESNANSMFKIQGTSLQACLLADMLSDPALPAAERNALTFLARVSTPERSMKGLLETIYAESKSRMARILAGTLMEVPSKTFSGFCVEATADLQWLMTTSHAELVSGTAPGSLKPSDFRKENLCIFLQLGVQTMNNTPQIGRAILNALLNDIYSADGATQRRYLLILDEINLFGRLKALSTVASQGRKHRITVTGYWHSLGQMKQTWGEAGAAAWRANASWEAYSAMDPDTAKAVSERCGCFTAMIRSEGTNRNNPGMSIFGGGQSRGRSINTSLLTRALLRPDEVERELRRDEQIIFKRGEQSPIRCLKSYYFRRPDLMAKVGADPYRSDLTKENAFYE